MRYWVRLANRPCTFQIWNLFNTSNCRDSGNDFRFPNIALHTGCFCLILDRISSVVSFRVDIRQLSLFKFVVYFCLIKMRLLVLFPYLSEMKSKCMYVCHQFLQYLRNRLQSDIRDPTFKICVPGRIITRSTDIRDPTLKKRNRETTKVVSTISASKLLKKSFLGVLESKYFTDL